MEGRTPVSRDRIRPLAQDVVNRIAAGEIIIAPMHALKEMIENSIDAGASWIEIVVKDGGLKLLQISDNGHGIEMEDMSILCERFTTSKLRSYEDLTQIASYGFRGEALASISHIAHLRVTTRTADADCAYQAHFQDGKLVPAKPGLEAKPRKVAGRVGTQITVEDLFYNIPQRQKAFRSQSEEFAKIIDIIGRYAIHRLGVAFTCKKHADNSLSLSVAGNAIAPERISTVYGQTVAKSLISFKVKNDALGFSASGYASNTDYKGKRSSILLFINHRAVESAAFKTALQRLYSIYLPKGCHPFIYASIEISPERVDVNVHPTKREVGFLNEDEIIGEIAQSIEHSLSQVDESRSFYTQTTLKPLNTVGLELTADQSSTEKRVSNSPHPTQKSINKALVRTDPKSRKITSMLASIGCASNMEELYRTSDEVHKQIKLTSVKELRQAVRSQIHRGLFELFANHTWVGLVDASKRVAAIQAGTKLLLVDYGVFCNEFFYQLGLTDFGNFGAIVFEEPLCIYELIEAAAKQEKMENPNLNLDGAAKKITEQLIEKREMLSEYFNLQIRDDGRLLSMPLLLRGYIPNIAKIPRFLMRLGPCVDWTEEKECFRTFLAELANYYTPECLPCEPERNLETDQEDIHFTNFRRHHVIHALEHAIFPAFKARMVPTKGLLSGVLEVADLKGLYKVFERC